MPFPVCYSKDVVIDRPLPAAVRILRSPCGGVGGKACVRLVSARAMEISEEWMKRKYPDPVQENPTADKNRNNRIPTPVALHDPVLSHLSIQVNLRGIH